MNYSEDNSGFYWVDWGWKGFTTHDDTENGLPQQVQLINAERVLFDITNTMVIITVFVMIFVLLIVFVLFMRWWEGKGYYFYIWTVKVLSLFYAHLHLFPLPSIEAPNNKN